MDTIAFQSGELIVGSGDYTYRRILDDFSNTKFIGIITYNISTRSGRTNLLDKLKTACQNGTTVTLITHIPKRFTSYYSPQYAATAKDAINNYIDKLNPEHFGPNVSVYFNFHNHAKFIVTDNMLYWGSSNYSDESRQNIECGTITTDPRLVSFIKDVFFPSVTEHSIPYYRYDLISTIANLRNASNYCRIVRDEIFYATFTPYSDYETGFEERWAYDPAAFSLTTKMLKKLASDFNEFEDALNTVRDIIDTSEEPSEEGIEELEKLDILYHNYEAAYEEMHELINSFIEDSKKAAEFNPEKEAFHILDAEYGMVAYDENLDYYVELAMSEAQDTYNQLIESTEPSIRSILNALTPMSEYFQQMSERLEIFLYVNPVIDNTGITIQETP